MNHLDHRILEALRTPLLVLDGRAHVHSSNPAFYRTFHTTPEETLGRDFYALNHGQWDLPALRVLLHDILQRHTALCDYEVIQELPTVGRRVLLLSAQLVEASLPENELVLVTIEDVTERWAIEARLQAYTARLEQSNRELQDFAQVASHDLQEPLRKIQAFGDLLRRQADRLDEDGQDCLQSMLGAATRMRSLIHALLGLARVTTQGKPFVQVDLGQIAAEVVEDLQARVREVGVTMQVEALPSLEADPTQMRQLLQNLVGNALKYRREGLPHLARVSARTTATLAMIDVHDTGIGFDEKYLDRIFAPFQRLHSRSQYEGTGMGLAICRRIAERHGGSITAAGNPGQGATFTVTLPLRQQESLP